jgi:MFS family permease
MTLEGINRTGTQPVVATLGFWTIYPLSVIYIFHSLLVAYINSSYMEQYLSPSGVGALFTIGSALSIVGFLYFTKLLRYFGNNHLTILLAVLDIASLVTLGLATSAVVAIPAFVLFLIINPILFLNIDIYAESIIGDDESATGTRRGITLTLMSLAGMCAPIVMGILAGPEDNLRNVYFAAAGVFVLFILFIKLRFTSFIDADYTSTKISDTLALIWRSKDLRGVIAAQFLLQVFFAWMIIYLPLYLFSELGMGWETISTIIAAGAFAYVLFEYPIGYLADKYYGEKEMMAYGFLILTVSSAWIAIMTPTATVGAWMVLMFTTRVGASLVEATSESYFFKHTNGKSADLINIFRLTRPLANLLGAMIGSVVLLLFPFSFTFIILALLMIPGLFFTMSITDTK